MSTRLRLILLATLALTLAGCAGDEAEPPPPPPVAATDGEDGTLPRGTAVIATDGADVRIDVEVAETGTHRQRGLMERVALPRNAGMIFLFEGETEGGFWMKNTLIPLSIAFFDDGGAIVRILDMEPCKADPCPVYDPGVGYHGALEVNRGMFRTWGVSRGDVITLVRG